MEEKMKAIVPKEMIFLDEVVASRNEAIHYLVKKAGEAGLVTDTSDLEVAVLAREEEISTAVGYQVAMPHGKSEAVNRPFIGFLRLKDLMKWNGSDEVKLIFLIAVPKSNVDNVHLRFIAQLSKNLLDDEFRSFIAEENDKEKIYRFFQAIKF